METKCLKNKMDRIRVKLGLSGMFLVDPIGRSGGLALLWKDLDEVTILNYSRRHILATVHSQNENLDWKLTGFYGHPDPMKRHEAWGLLKFLKDLSLSPWLCVGD